MKGMYTIFLLTLSWLPLQAQQQLPELCFDEVNTFDRFFETEEPLHLTLEFDITEFRRSRADEEYMDARLLQYINDTCYIPFAVKLRTRGIFRRDHCFLPPFWMNIEDSEIKSPGLEDVEKFKIVTHCMRKDFYQDYLLKEYLAYRIYNIISPYSFRVRLLRITYIDTGRHDKKMEGWAFAIEPKEMLARRLHADVIENENLSMQHMNDTVMDRLCMFNYMIGNTDYSVAGLHNIKVLLLREPGRNGYIPVPYDFDFTGIVNTIYAKPAANTNISRVTDRYYTGPCRTDFIYEGVLDDFRANSEAIHYLLQNFEYMDLKEKLEMLRFVEGFFDDIERKDFIEWKLRISCK